LDTTRTPGLAEWADKTAISNQCLCGDPPRRAERSGCPDAVRHVGMGAERRVGVRSTCALALWEDCNGSPGCEGHCAIFAPTVSYGRRRRHCSSVGAGRPEPSERCRSITGARVGAPSEQQVSRYGGSQLLSVCEKLCAATALSVIGYRRYQVLSNSWWCDTWMSVDPEAEVAAATARAVVTSVITRAVLSATRHCESPSVHWTRWFLVPSPHALTSGGATR
jgi:hypothetical protein